MQWIQAKVTCWRYGPFGNRIQQGKGCQKCSSRPRSERQSTERAGKAAKFMISQGFKPLVEYLGTHNSWLSICLVCGEETSPRLSGRKSGQGACMACGRQRRSDAKKLPDKQGRLSSPRSMFMSVPIAAASSLWSTAVDEAEDKMRRTCVG